MDSLSETDLNFVHNFEWHRQKQQELMIQFLNTMRGYPELKANTFRIAFDRCYSFIVNEMNALEEEKSIEKDA
tara:strand:- start:1431 stop:1649 length:219 start_codon:yes stop_codon:yes gene_type:complete